MLDHDNLPKRVIVLSTDDFLKLQKDVNMWLRNMHPDWSVEIQFSSAYNAMHGSVYYSAMLIITDECNEGTLARID